MIDLMIRDCLTAEREYELALLAAAGNRNAKDELILSNTRFVASFVKKFRGYGLDDEELFEEGLIGLCQAVEHFNPNKGARLITYASFWIRNAVLNAINECGARIRLPGADARKVIQLKKALAEAQTIYDNFQDCLDYACDCCNISRKNAKILLSMVQENIYLDSPSQHDESISMGQQISESRFMSVEEEFLENEEKNVFLRSMKKLKPEEQEVLKLHYGLFGNEPEAFSSIAPKIGKSRARVHQIEKIAMKRLQNELRASNY